MIAVKITLNFLQFNISYDWTITTASSSLTVCDVAQSNMVYLTPTGLAIQCAEMPPNLRKHGYTCLLHLIKNNYRKWRRMSSGKTGNTSNKIQHVKQLNASIQKSYKEVENKSCQIKYSVGTSLSNGTVIF